ncbi:MAG: PSD1 domain-containing protein [Planctomycetaceae bacterium]|nr:PSD1 domain-containing protein [Planctomycetales bacterium]MCB9927358.1 PSD1 domain-containing protein [Planctomycetaceae bacterium]
MNHNWPNSSAKTFVILLVGFLGPASNAEEITYEREIRPIFKTHCFQCHGEGGVLQGGLDLRLRRLIAKGGDSGESFVAGQPQESLLVQRLLDGEMPPEEVALRPTAEEIELVQRWITGGAVASRSEPEDLNPDNYITDEEQAFWSFQPVHRQNPPDVQTAARVRVPLDRFIIAKLDANNLTISPDADSRTIVRRVYFDLLGLPPTPDEIDEFLNDSSADAYERMLDRVLNSPHYGERWGRHWLDVAGYADSEGYAEEDPVRPYAYKYRDYVIRAFNDDKPFNQFVIEQLAGDELLTPPFENLTPEQAQKLVATGFLRTAPDGTGVGGVDQDVARNDVMAKTIQIVSTSLTGLTVGCAQCHNHRYDPISHEDYHAIRAIFEPSLDWKNWLAPAKRRVSLYTDADRAKSAEIEAQAIKILDERTIKQNEYIEATFQKELAKLEASLREPIMTARSTPDKERTAEQKKLLKEHPSVNVTASSLYLYDKKAADELKKMADEAAAVRATKPTEEFVRAVWEPTGKAPPPTFLFHRGDHEQPKQQVAPRELTVLTSLKPIELPTNDESLPTSGRRLAYAKWLTSGEHPLVARVIVNRIWLNHFGRGLVPTPGDFGALGVEPTHLELLDWLASEFVESGWSIKELHRLIMTSTAYRQASLRDDKGDTVDADNTLYWRMPVRRLEAEVLRDAVLAVSGELNTTAFGPPVPVMADRVGQFVIGKENLDAGRPGTVIPMNGEDLRRSVYIESRRSRPLSIMEPFDLPRMEPNCTSRNASTVSPQSLLLMNSDFALTRAMQLATRVQRDASDNIDSQITLAWQLAYAAQPTEEELTDAKSFIQGQTDYFAANPPPTTKDAQGTKPADEAFASFCHALLSSNRFLYID